MLRSVRVAGVIAIVLVVAACAGRGSPKTIPSSTGPLVRTREPTPVVVTNASVRFQTELRSIEEVPPIGDAESACSGQAQLLVRVELDAARNITAATAQMSILVRDCPASTQITLAHVHRGPIGVNGPVVIDSGLVASSPIRVEDREIGINQTDIAIRDFALVTEMAANPRAFYVNVHSVRHPDGLIRGQLSHMP